jgi:hypothetical protein
MYTYRCERPIAFTLQAAKEVFELARSKKAIFMPMLPGRPGKVSNFFFVTELNFFISFMYKAA